MALTQPTFAGVRLPRPSLHDRVPVEVKTTSTLADGSEAVYHLGHRMVFTLRWDAATDAESSLVERLGLVVGPQEYVDMDGGVYVVTVHDTQSRTAIPGTDPVRYDVGLTLQEDSPRQVPPPPPTLDPVVETPDRPQAVVSDTDPRVLLVFAGERDPANPDVLVWTV